MSETTTAEHLAVIDPFRALATALPADSVHQPDMPVPVFIREGLAIIDAAKEFEAELEKVGYDKDNTTMLASRLKALLSAQRLWGESRKGRRGEEALQLIEDAESLRSDILSAGLLALRHDRRALGKLSAIRMGDGFADLADDLSALALLLTTEKDAFSAIKLDIDETASAANKAREVLLEFLSDEALDGVKAQAKSMRDRLFTLCLEPLREIRHFASYTFRKDDTPKRRQLFLSSHNRKIQNRYRNKKDQPGFEF